MSGKSAMLKSILTKINPRANGGARKEKIFAGLLGFFMLALLILSFGTIPESLGKFRHAGILRDAMRMAKFDVTITAPDAFLQPIDGLDFEHIFFSEAENRTLYFQISNHGEMDVFCTPHIDNGIEYFVILPDGEASQFLVRAGEDVEFAVVIFAVGLDRNGTEAVLSVDIEQAGGG